ncbi:flagellar basal body protein FliL [Saccharomonospora sp. NPDC006951]
MSWQEELRKLDEELASGRLSADDYRVRRDQVLSSAVAHGEDPNAAAETQQQQVSQQQETPQQEQSQDGEGQNADSTQVIAPLDPSAERTQTVPPWQAQHVQQGQQMQQPPQAPYGQQPPMPQAGGYQQGPASPAGGFQQPGPASPAGGFQQPGPASPSGGFQQQQGYPQQQQFPQQPQPPQQPWNAGQPDQAPPWGGGDFPPLGPGGPDWGAAQGPEGFEDGQRKSGKGKIFAIIGAVVVLAGIAVGAYLLWGTGDDNADPPPPGTSQQQNPPPSSEPAEDPLPIGEISGQPEEHSEVKTFDDVPGLTYLNDQEVESYERTEPGDTKFTVYRDGQGATAVILLTKVGDKGAASDEVSSLATIQTDNGAESVTDGVPDGVLVTAFEDGAQYRAHYLSGDVLVRVEAVSENGLEAARAYFDDALEAQLKVLPVDG